MKFLTLEPFVPSGSNFEGSKSLFVELGFSISWDGGDYIGFERDGCRFILQRYDNSGFAENLMISVGISDADEFWQHITERKLGERYGIRTAPPTRQAYGREVNIIDLAGVCWHFVAQ